MCETLRIAIVDDDGEARAILNDHLRRYERSHSDVLFDVHEYESGEAMLRNWRGDADVVMLDVEMGDLDGFETARAIRERDIDVTLLFVTNMAQFAIRGYEVNALSYLLKPVSYFAFAREIDRCLTAKRVRGSNETMTFSTARGVARVPLSHITYLECSKHKIIVHAVDARYEFTGTLKSFLPQLEGKGFVTVNSCYLVNLRYVVAVDQTICQLRDDTRLAVSRRRRKQLLEALAATIAA
ncbi:DNA-binding response regulator [Bifidobacterium lemurum]|uniref:DNA-binding response regulator n=1 Tax=Bifidobacterium lemurum TaxID=1603886 RepID=A0A261FKL8_9BIFI|nr:LytTR family DNA-binding domain-containing protein [Bifidobacterium lemurum]OZG59555.1 DNA-binding response regulator [Bifidobacterium lemurum]QOL35019.1 response regulator transcription factor [Bifidobacterium lemurum]